MSTTVVITGASRGIGLALTALYKARGDRVIAVVRKSTPELDAIVPDQIITGADFSTDAASEVVTTALGSQKVDVLINNAVRVCAGASGCMSAWAKSEELVTNSAPMAAPGCSGCRHGAHEEVP